MYICVQIIIIIMQREGDRCDGLYDRITNAWQGEGGVRVWNAVQYYSLGLYTYICMRT